MIDRGQVVFLDVVTGAGLVDAAAQIDAQAIDHVARPAAAIALHLESLFGGQNIAGAQAFGMEQEIPLLAKQPKAISHLPGNPHPAVYSRRWARSLRAKRHNRCKAGQQRQRCAEDDQTRGKSHHGGFDVSVGAKIRTGFRPGSNQQTAGGVALIDQVDAVPTFRTTAAISREPRKAIGTSNSMILVPLSIGRA